MIHSAPYETLLFRSIIAVGAVASLETYIPNLDVLNPQFIICLILVLIYLLGTAIVERYHLDKERLPVILNYIGHADAMLIGSFLAIINFDLMATGLLFSIVQFRALSSGGAPRWIKDNLAFTTGLLLIVLFNSPEFNTRLDQPISIIALVFVGVYFCVSGYYFFEKNSNLQKKLAEIEQNQIRLKMLNYQFSKYLSPNVREKIERGREVKLSSQRKRLVVFFSDIVGFSEIADEMDESALTVLINDYLTEMSKIALEFGGTIDKFIGDAVMVFFGDPNTSGPKEDCIACVSMALTMRRKAAVLQTRWKSNGLVQPLQVRMGISTGFCTVGNFGTETRLDYTLLGSEVNLASRLETSAKAGEILISQSAYELVKDIIYCEDRGTVEVKGFKSPIKTYAAIDFRKNLGKDQNFLDFTTGGFSLLMDGEKVANYDETKILATLNQAIHHFQNKKP